MDADGSNAQRLSNFNDDGDDIGALGAAGVGHYRSDRNWSPDEHYFFGDVETNLLNSDSVILRVSLTCQAS